MSDLIKREDAIKFIKRCKDRLQGRGLTYEIMLDMFETMPSADRPQGEWIRDRYWSRGIGMGEDYGFFYKCSLCEYEVENGYTRCGFNFCPYCGCRMKGADDETD